MRPNISQSRTVSGGHDRAARRLRAHILGVRRQCRRDVSGLSVTRKGLVFVEGRIAKRPLCAARVERAS
jgi:hypothetical protein